MFLPGARKDDIKQGYCKHTISVSEIGVLSTEVSTGFPVSLAIATPGSTSCSCL